MKVQKHKKEFSLTKEYITIWYNGNSQKDKNSARRSMCRYLKQGYEVIVMGPSEKKRYEEEIFMMRRHEEEIFDDLEARKREKENLDDYD